MNQQDLTTIDFYESRERYAMHNFYELHLKDYFKDYKTELHLTPTHKQNSSNRQCYDAIIILRDRISLKMYHKFIIEIKFRDADYDTVMLEKSKYNLLQKTKRDALKIKFPYEEVHILYINFNYNSTTVFNLTSDRNETFLKKRINKVKEDHVKTTFIANDIKVCKDIYYLPKELGKQFPPAITKDYKLVYEYNKSLNTPTPIKPEQPIKNTFSIF